jgi:hypothetical protein
MSQLNGLIPACRFRKCRRVGMRHGVKSISTEKEEIFQGNNFNINVVVLLLLL